jgi:hypothetical protein
MAILGIRRVRGHRIAGAGQFLLLDQQVLARGLHSWGETIGGRFIVMLPPSGIIDDIEQALPVGALALHPIRCHVERNRARGGASALDHALHDAGLLSTGCLEILASKLKAAWPSPTVFGPSARRSTMPRRIGCERLNGSFTIR